MEEENPIFLTGEPGKAELTHEMVVASSRSDLSSKNEELSWGL